MIGIFVSTEYHAAIKEEIAKFDRLHELIEINNDPSAVRLPNGHTLLVEKGMIQQAPDWFNQSPPMLFPDTPFDAKILVGLALVRLHNFEAAKPLLQNLPDIWEAVLQYSALCQGISYELPGKKDTTGFIPIFNRAIALHYAPVDATTLETVANAYEEALIQTNTEEQHFFCVKHYATLLADAGLLEDAAELLTNKLQKAAHLEYALQELKWLRCSVWMQQLKVPYDIALMEALKNDLWDVLLYLEKYNRHTEQGLLLMDACQLALYSDSFAESLGYINKAIQLLDKSEQPELVADAHFKKGMLLYSWAENGQPQFYRAAKDALLAALEVFNRHQFPEVFADIHHYLGVIYSAIPDEVQKKSIWAGVSVSSFHEALNYYNKVDTPYAFAQICNHFGNAYTKYPVAALGDNFEKALDWYREALDVRTAKEYPFERSLTLSNYLDASWKAGNPGDGWSTDRFNDMWEKASELKQLESNQELTSEAEKHLDALIKLKADSSISHVN